MRIIYFNHCTGMYGASKSLFQLVKEMKEVYEVESIVITPDNGDLNSELSKIGIENYVFRYCWWVYKENYFTEEELEKKKERYNTINKKSIEEMYEFFKNKNVDIIHSNSITIDIGADLALKMNIPHIWHIRELLSEHYSLTHYCYLDEAYKKMQSMSSKVICISDIVRNRYRGKIENDKLELIYNGIEEIDYINKRNDGSRFNMIFTGVISEDKNQIELLKALNILINQKKYNDLDVYFAGNGDETYIKELKLFIKENKLDSNVKFLGYVKNVATILGQYDVGIVCSKCEAFGRTTVEYMMNELITIACNTGANKEIIDHKINGFIYEYNNFYDLSRKIEYVYNNRYILEELRRKAREKALTKFTSKVNSERIYELYKSLQKN